MEITNNNNDNIDQYTKVEFDSDKSSQFVVEVILKSQSLQSIAYQTCLLKSYEEFLYH
jgi:hypothetical protein